MGMLLAAPAGNDILFDEHLCEQGRNFCNKLWNAFRLLSGWQVDDTIKPTEVSEKANLWFKARLSQTIELVDDLFEKFRLNEALMAIYRLVRDDYSSWYLEMIKPEYGKPIDSTTYGHAIEYMDALLRLLHPFMPFITEELWQNLRQRRPGESVMYASAPKAVEYSPTLIDAMAVAQEIVAAVRGTRAAKGLSPRQALDLNILGSLDKDIPTVVITKLANINGINENAEKDPLAASFMVGTTEFNIPMELTIDAEAELQRLTKDLEYNRGFLQSVERKLSNERFVANAPAAVVEAERRKQADATAKIATLEASIAAIKSQK